MVQIPRSAIAGAGAGPGGVNTPISLRQNPAASAAPALALQRGAAEVAQVAGAMADKRRQLDEMENSAKELAAVSMLVIEMRGKASRLIEEARLKDPLTQGARTTEIMTELSLEANTRSQVFTVRNREYVAGTINNMASSVIPPSNREQTKAIRNQALTVMGQNIEAGKRRAVESNDPFVVEAEKVGIEDLLAQQARAGITRNTAQVDFQEARIDIDKQRGVRMYSEDPDAFAAIPFDELQKMFPDLNPQGIEDLIQGATKEGDRRQKEEEEATEKQRKERVEVLMSSAGKQELSPALVNDFVENSLIKPEDGVKILNFQANAAKNNVTVSDPDTYQFFDEQMITANPAEWNMLLRQNMSGPNAKLSKADGLALLEKTKKINDLRNIPGYTQAVRGIKDFLGGTGYSITGFATDADKQIVAAIVELNERVLKGEAPTAEMWGEIAFRQSKLTPPQIPGQKRYGTRKQVEEALAAGFINEATTDILIAEIRGTDEFKEAEEAEALSQTVEADLKTETEKRNKRGKEKK